MPTRGSTGATRCSKRDRGADIAQGTFFAGLALWALLELTAGVNWPHRVLGGAGLLYVVVKVAETL